MDKIRPNGNMKSMQDMEGKTIEFPVTFELKVVMLGTNTDEQNKENLSSVFNQLAITHKYRHKKISSKGTYTSYTFEVILDSKEKMEKMYADLKHIEGLKFAL